MLFKDKTIIDMLTSSTVLPRSDGDFIPCPKFLTVKQEMQNGILINIC